MESLAFHSHKGGVGKTTLAVNIAYLLVSQGKRVCLIDNDFAGPSLQTFFDLENHQYLNSYFENSATLEETIFEKKTPGLSGTLYVGLADPTSDSMEKMVRLDKKFATTMLKKQFNIKKILLQDPYKIDYLLIDTSPGIGITVANSFMLTDHVLFVTKISNADIDGTVTIMNGYNEMLDQKSFIVANQVPAAKTSDSDEMEKLKELIATKLIRISDEITYEFLGCVANNEKFILTEYEGAITRMEGKNVKRTILVNETSEGDFYNSMKLIIEKIFLGA